MTKRARRGVVRWLADDAHDLPDPTTPAYDAPDPVATAATARPAPGAPGVWSWHPAVLPVVLAVLVALLLVATPPYVVENGGLLRNADAIPLSALWIWLLDGVVVAGVVLCRRAPRLSLALVTGPFVVSAFFGVMPMGWWVALVLVAAVAALTNWRGAVPAALLAGACAATFALTDVPFLTPSGPLYAESPLVQMSTEPSGLSAGITTTSSGGVELVVLENDESAVGVVGTEVGEPWGSPFVVSVPTTRDWSSTAVTISSGTGRSWWTRSAVLVGLLAIQTLVIGAFATVAAARRTREAKRAAREAIDAASARSEAAEEESRAAEAVSRQATAISERARVARDLHDVVAHHISLVAVRAESARYAIPDLPDEARKALVDIADEARGALQELRLILAVLQRTEDGVPPDDTMASRSPQPGSTDIPDLVRTAVDAGQQVELLGTVPDLPAAEGVAVYRMVQESLTNARRHAPGEPVTIAIERAHAGYRVRVSNPLVGVPGRLGRGLVGMRERVESLGGTLSITTTSEPDPRFVVQARLPEVRAVCEASAGDRAEAAGHDSSETDHGAGPDGSGDRSGRVRD